MVGIIMVGIIMVGIMVVGIIIIIIIVRCCFWGAGTLTKRLHVFLLVRVCDCVKDLFFCKALTWFYNKCLRL